MKIMKRYKIIIVLLIIFVLTGCKIYVNSQRDASYYDSNVVGDFIDCNEYKMAVPGDALYYCEYYYSDDVSEFLSENYRVVTSDDIHEAEFYLNHFKTRYLSESMTGNKDFLSAINEGDFYALRSGCSNEVNEGHFLLHFYDKESKTIYKMWRCQ